MNQLCHSFLKNTVGLSGKKTGLLHRVIGCVRAELGPPCRVGSGRASYRIEANGHRR